MSLEFTYLIRDPYLRLIVEYFDYSGRCICNDFVDDILNLSMVNKETHNYIKDNNLLSCTHYHIDIPKDLLHFFRIPSFCWKHHISNLKPEYLHHLYKTIRKLYDNKEKYDNFPTERLLMYDGEYEYFHCDSNDQTEEVKNIIRTYGVNIYTGNSCCSGRGFSLLIKSEN
jgi:hypothetical protein